MQRGSDKNRKYGIPLRLGALCIARSLLFFLFSWSRDRWKSHHPFLESPYGASLCIVFLNPHLMPRLPLVETSCKGTPGQRGPEALLATWKQWDITKTNCNWWTGGLFCLVWIDHSLTLNSPREPRLLNKPKKKNQKSRTRKQNHLPQWGTPRVGGRSWFAGWVWPGTVGTVWSGRKIDIGRRGLQTAVGQSSGTLSRSGEPYPTPPIVPRTATAANLWEPPFSDQNFDNRGTLAVEVGPGQQAQEGAADQV